MYDQTGAFSKVMMDIFRLDSVDGCFSGGQLDLNQSFEQDFHVGRLGKPLFFLINDNN